jgi:hypothetical protein
MENISLSGNETGNLDGDGFAGRILEGRYGGILDERASGTGGCAERLRATC